MGNVSLEASALSVEGDRMPNSVTFLVTGGVCYTKDTGILLFVSQYHRSLAYRNGTASSSVQHSTWATWQDLWQKSLGGTFVRQWSDLPFPITWNVIFSQGVFFYFFSLNFFTMYYKAVYIVYMRVATSQLFQVLFEACVERFWLAMYVFSCFVSYDGICVVQSSKVGMHS